MMLSRSHERPWIEALQIQQEKGLFRQLHHAPSAPLLDFTMNDYLGLSSHPHVKEGSMRALQQEGAGRCSSRLVGGGYALLDQLERALAAWYGKERALLFPSGYQANVASLSALLSPSALVIADRHIHRSLVDGIRLSRARLLRYPHGNLAAMEALLSKHHAYAKQILCITESVFSMHGTLIDLDAFCGIAARFGAISYVDDAHGFCVLPESEKRRCASADIVLTTLSKGLGGQGGALLGKETLISYLINFSGGFMYTTSLAPPLAGGALAALQLLPSLQTERKKLWDLTASFAARASTLGLPIRNPSPFSPIQPIYLGMDHVLEWQTRLRKKQIAAVAIRPPTVPWNDALLRFSLSSAHSLASLDTLFAVLKGS